MPGQLAYRRVDTSAFLARAVAAEVGEVTRDDDRVGLLRQRVHGRADEYAQLRALLAPLSGGNCIDQWTST